MRNISNFVNVHWYIGMILIISLSFASLFNLLGVPFNNPQELRLEILRAGQAILGDYLLGAQVGNEPDLYPGRRRAQVMQSFHHIPLLISRCYLELH
jgi:hypothetical protein